FAATAVAAAQPAHADPGTCQYLGTYYDQQHPCDQPIYPNPGNPPYGSQLPPFQCQGINAHNVGCS
ncbi:hypothetical protein, partial [Mycobacterium sp. E1319]|uniref:hypothetical protein n=1 Tax=Mycobacterium sp. E1319 TaxID=1834124 RepID=UPI000AE33176